MSSAVAEKNANLENRFSLVAVGHKMRRVLEAADDVAGTNATVLLVGESGTGKEVLSRYIHGRSPRANGPWVAVNCAALPSELLEAELFGYERGAFTGASARHKGRIEQAHGGTLLLDEISEMPLLLQAKMLRVLQEREVQRVGGSGVVPVDVRVIATSNRDLPRMVAEGGFRADLYYRINVFPIELPALRERPEEIPALAEHLLLRAALRIGRDVARLSPAALQALSQHPLPGNARELSNILERALIRAQGRPVIDVAELDLPRPSTLQLVPAEGVTAPSMPVEALTPPVPASPPAMPAGLPPSAMAMSGMPLGWAAGAPAPKATSPGYSPFAHPVGVGPAFATALPQSAPASPLPPAAHMPAKPAMPAAPLVPVVPPASSANQATPPLGEDLDLSRLERRAILEALRRTEGNRTHAARMLGIGLRTLRNKLRAMREEECDVPEPTSGMRLAFAEELP